MLGAGIEVENGSPDDLMTVGSLSCYAVLASFSLGLVTCKTATTDEPVSIRRVVGNKAILSRGDQDFYLVETRPACPSLAHEVGRAVLVSFPEGLLGPQSDLVLGGQRQPCKIARAAALFSNRASSPVYNTAETGSSAFADPHDLLVLQEAFMLLGHDPGTVGSKAETLKAADEIRRQYGNEPTPEGLRKTAVLVALQVVSRNPNDDRAKQVSRKLLNMALGPDSLKIQP